MYAQEEKPKENKVVAKAVVQKKSDVKQGFGFVDNVSEAIAQKKLISSISKHSAKVNTIQRAGDDLKKHGFSVHNDPGVGSPKIYYSNIGTEHRYVALRSAFFNTHGSAAGAFGYAHAGKSYSNEYGTADDMNGNKKAATVGQTMSNTSVVHANGHMLPSMYGGLGTPANTFEQNSGENSTNPWRASENEAGNVWRAAAGLNPWVYYSVYL